jgi:hypothetical protein
VFGWTVLGWLLAFVLACTGKTRADEALEAKRQDELLLMMAASGRKDI